MVDDTRRFLTAALCGASGLIAAVFVAAPASANPVVPDPPPPPVVGSAIVSPTAPVQNVQPAQPGRAPVAVVTGPVRAVTMPLETAAAPGQAAETAPVDPAAPVDGTPHLASPDALPPGATLDAATQGAEGPNVSYLKDLWQAVQNHEISGKEALIMGLAQRGMNTPYPTQAAGPNVPLTPGNAPQLAGPPAPAAPPAPGAPVPPPAPVLPDAPVPAPPLP